MVMNHRQLRTYLGSVVFVCALFSMLFLLLGQIWHVAAKLVGGDGFEFYTELSLSLGMLLLGISAVWSFYKGVDTLKGVTRLGKRERWLSKVYENAPVAVFVMQNDAIIYSNGNFEELKHRHNQPNPFSDCSNATQECWLTDQNGQRYAYQVEQFTMANDKDVVYIITEITTNKMHEQLVKRVGLDLTHHGSASFETMLDTVAEFIPNSLVYMGRYKVENNSFVYMAHKGESEDANVFSEIQLSSSVFYHNQWVWLTASQITKQGFNNFIAQYKAKKLGSIIFCDEMGVPLGVILVVLKQEVTLSNLVMDFLSILSVRMRSEFEHANDQRLIQKSGDQYRAFIQRSNEAIVELEIRPSLLVDDQFESLWKGLIDYADVADINPKANQLFELPKNVTGADVLAIKSIKHIMSYVLQSGFGSEAVEVLHETSTGEMKWIHCSIMSEIEEGRLHRVWIIARDVTDAKTHIQNLEHQTRHDGLTGLPNRAAVLDILEEKTDQAQQFGFKTALLMIDLDRFKEINDALGHHYGDVLLKKIAPRMKPLLAETRSHLARLGGDEFAVIIPSIQSVSEAEDLARKILDSIKEPFDLGQLNVEISGSVGITVYPDDGTDSNTLMRCADVAMYKAKTTAGGILCYRNDLDDSSPRRLEIMASMGKGLRKDEFFMCFQPKVDVNAQAVTSAEALIRWRHPELGLVSPGEFIPLAEMSDVIIDMTEWVIDKTLQQIEEWRKQDLFVKVSVNVSTRNLLDENLITYLKSKLAQYRVPAHLLEIEITESALMADPDRALDTINKISELGVSISVDDFGTGYSSLVYLRQLPLNALKIDITFVRNMCHNEQDEIIVNSIINLSHNLGLVVVAEGAEDKATVDRLQEMNCDQVQGFYFSKPLEADEFRRYCMEFVHSP